MLQENDETKGASLGRRSFHWSSEMLQDNDDAKGLTVKSIIVGLIGVLLVVGTSKFSYTICHGPVFLTQLSPTVLCYLFIICAVWNPIAFKFFPKKFLNVKELVVAAIITFVSAGFAWWGWMKQMFVQTAQIPQKATIDPQWLNYKIFDLFNKNIFPNGGVYDERVTGGFINGLNAEAGWVNPFKIPFWGWSNMLYWAPLILLISFMLLGLVLVVHRQWIKNEKLVYPLASVAESLVKKTDAKSCFADIFKSTSFWISFASVALFFAYNSLVTAHHWGFQPMPTSYKLDGLPGVHGIYGLTTVNIYWFLIGLAYLLPPALSLSVGLNVILYVIFSLVVLNVTGEAPTAADDQGLRSGAYFAFFLMLIFFGRRYYFSLLSKALYIKPVPEEDKTAVFGMRLAIITFIASTVLLVFMGLDPIFAFLFMLMLVIVYMVFTRLTCETGLPVIQAPVYPSVLYPKLMGGAAIGPRNLMTNGLLSGVFFYEIKVLLVGYLATAAKIADNFGINLKKFFKIAGWTIVGSFIFGFFIFIWQYYSYGISEMSSKTNNWQFGIVHAVSDVSRLHVNGVYDASATAGIAEKFRMLAPDGEVCVFFLIGILFVFFCGFMRTRFLWWPIHAVIFCIWQTSPAYQFWACFLLGWVCRTLALKIGGETSYMRLKPIFFGLIFGEVFIRGFASVFGIGYWMLTGQPCPYSIQN